ncbi:hypothetical protein LSH36_1540g00007 [Paralvinella palmiformis]|uniref:Uncharacterized protein n=1 Tax=Paralvinella palmiformis TaxID=53620 RepID=A0AAD9MMT4_9ANNE|nr:hypothetical protein LSH36_1540g00007 [Paralvinella palmiformis]
MCNGYKSQGEEDPKCGEEMIWRFVYEADRINFAMTSETSCTDSGHIDDNHGCQKVYDGTVEPQIGHEWALYTTIGNEKWIKVNGTCDGSNQYLTCTNQARFSQYNLSPEVITEWVKIKVIEMCLPQDVKHFGFIEVRTMGRFMRD